jgi:(p)ppGpp synthase/HD superfamily hydrolase
MDTTELPLITRARLLALEAHAGMAQERESGEVRPQIVHLQEVADLVWAIGGTDEEIAAAWLHDSLEDTSLRYEDILLQCGSAVADLVYALTDEEGMAALPLFERKQKQAERIRTKSDSVKKIKIADQTSNVRTIALDRPLQMSPEECAVYIEGAKKIAEVCKGISAVLDDAFLSAHARASIRYRRS